jgi:hypothetical protein
MEDSGSQRAELGATQPPEKFGLLADSFFLQLSAVLLSFLNSNMSDDGYGGGGGDDFDYEGPGYATVIVLYS